MDSPVSSCEYLSIFKTVRRPFLYNDKAIVYVLYVRDTKVMSATIPPKVEAHPAIAANIVSSVKTGYLPGTKRTLEVNIPITGVEYGGRKYRVTFGGPGDSSNASTMMHAHTAVIRIAATLTDSAGAPITGISNIVLNE